MKLTPRLFSTRKIVLGAVSFLSLASIAAADAPYADTNPFERSVFGDDWGVLSSDIFFGGAGAMFGLSPASRMLMLSTTSASKTSSDSNAIVDAASSSENLFNFASSLGSAFAIGARGPVSGGGDGDVSPNGGENVLPPGSPYQWQGPAGGAWNVSANWSPTGTDWPNAQGDTASNVQTVTTSVIQNTPGGVTVGTIGHDAVNEPESWTITPTTAITLDQDGAGPLTATIRNTDSSATTANQLIILSGTGGLVLADDLTITNTGGSTSTNGSIRIAAVISGSGNITTRNVSNSFVDGRGAIVLQGANTFTGTTTIAKGLTTFNNSTTFSSGQINLGQAGQGDTSLISTAATVNAANNIVVAAGTGGISLLGSSSSGGTYSGTITLNGDVTLANLNSATNTTTFSNTISGNGGVRVIGPGISLLSHANTFAGVTTVDSGTLNAGATGALANTSGIIVNSGGTLLLSGAGTNRINDSPLAGFNLNGGVFNTGGVSEVNGPAGSRTPGIGALTLSATSTINFGTGASIIEFAGLGAHVPIAGANLLITNWTGTPNAAGGTDQLLFAGVIADFTTKFDQSDVTFNSLVGYNIFQITPDYYEVTMAPEPGTWIGAAFALAAIGFMQRRRFAKRSRVVG